eukprot:c6026_g1_i1.p1 GENE.c6026_g1_i1~~c6026_g1_i1.p1  ORF type:complete len:387 (-),score=74.40 c6026_g1_i1:34-1194(-)
MKVRSVLVSVAVLVACHAESAQLEIDPSIPKDKCGVTLGVHEDDRTGLFILGADRSFYYKSETAENDWTTWKSLGGNFKGGPSVVRSYDGRLEVFGRGVDNAIWYSYQVEANSDDWTRWLSLGNKFASDPVAVLSSEGFIHIFAKGADGSLAHKTQYMNNTIFEWTEWTSLGGSLTSQPAVMLDAEGLIHVFVRGPDRALWHKYQIGGQEPRFVKWSEWQSLGGVLASAPRVPIALNNVNLLEIFVRASDKAYWHRSQVASLPPGEHAVSWNEWQSLGGVFSSGPSAVVNGEGLVEAFGRGADKAVWRKSQYLVDGVPKWSNWASLTGITSTGPAVRVRGDGLVDVYVRGVDKQIWLKSQSFFKNSTKFENWRSMDGSVLAEAFAC